MLASNELYKTNLNEIDPNKDIFGVPINIGSIVIYQPFNACTGMHLGTVVEKGKYHWYKIKKHDGHCIDRHNYELVVYLPILLRNENHDDKI
jgi:hypothetical protein